MVAPPGNPSAWPYLKRNRDEIRRRTRYAPGATRQRQEREEYSTGRIKKHLMRSVLNLKMVSLRRVPSQCGRVGSCSSFRRQNFLWETRGTAVVRANEVNKSSLGATACIFTREPYQVFRHPSHVVVHLRMLQLRIRVMAKAHIRFRGTGSIPDRVGACARAYSESRVGGARRCQDLQARRFPARGDLDTRPT